MSRFFRPGALGEPHGRARAERGIYTAPSSPKAIAGLAVWLKADALVLSDGAAVSTWADSSGSGRNATQGVGANQPTYKTAIVNGLPVVRFAGAGGASTFNSLVFATFPAFTQQTVFIVVKVVSDPGLDASRSGLWIMGVAGAANNTHYPFSDGIIYDDAGSTVRKTTVNPTPSLSSAFRTYCVRSAPSDWQTFLDGSQLFSTGTNTVGQPAAPTLGRSFDVSPSIPALNGDIAEFLVYDSALSATDRLAVESYLRVKYALA